MIDASTDETEIESCDRNARRLLAVLSLLAAYLLFANLAIVLRLEARAWGFRLSTSQSATLVRALLYHAAATILVLVSCFAVRSIRPSHPALPRLALAILPLAVLVSVDRMVAFAEPPIPKASGVYIAHPTRGWALRNGWTGFYHLAPTHINSLGCRGPEMSIEKQPDEFRVLVLGDSVAFGLRVEEKDTFASKLVKLAESRGTPQRRTVINLSVPGYSPWQEHDMLVAEGMRYQPDALVQVFCLNDVLDKFRLKRFGGDSRLNEPPAPSPLEWSGLFRVLRAWHEHIDQPTRQARRRLSRRFIVRRLLDGADADLIERGWRITLEHMKDIADTAKAESLPHLLVLATHGLDFQPNTSSLKPPRQVLAEFAEANDIDFLDLTPLFLKYATKHDIDAATLMIDGLHFSAKGHTIAAGAIDEWLRDRDVRDPESGS